jgi:hypothetical protein
LYFRSSASSGGSSVTAGSDAADSSALSYARQGTSSDALSYDMYRSMLPAQSIGAGQQDMYSGYTGQGLDKYSAAATGSAGASTSGQRTSPNQSSSSWPRSNFRQVSVSINSSADFL